MAFIKKLWTLKQVKIGLAAVCIAAILVVSFFLPKAPAADTADNALDALPAESTSPPVDSMLDVSLNTPETSPDDSDSTPEPSQSDTPDSPEETSLAASSASDKDKYETDPVPEGKPNPVESVDVTVDGDEQRTCTLSIRCDTILNNMDLFNQDKLGVLPSNGVILQTITVTYSEGESVFDVLQRVTREKRIHMEYVFTPLYNSAYIEGISNLYEFDCGSLSGWMYKVNGWFPNYGCSRYVLSDGDKIEWVYTCDLGEDVGGGYSAGQG